MNITVIAEHVHLFRDTAGLQCGYRHLAESVRLPVSPPPKNAVHSILQTEPHMLPHIAKQHPNGYVA
jgi:hypothetical protein